MPISIQVSQMPEAADPYAALQSEYGQELLRLYKAGASLCVWRCSSPWNYYLETASGEQYTICGQDEGEPGQGNRQLRALQQLSKHGGRSSRTIQYALSRWEIGQPEKEWWCFDAQRAVAAEELWAQTQEQFKRRTASQKPFQPGTENISETALALLRTLRDGSVLSLPRFQELESSYAELDERGIVEMQRNGRFSLVPAAKQMRIPRGKQLKFVSRQA